MLSDMNEPLCKPSSVVRKPCIHCALKHVAQARALLLEAVQGYEDHVWYAIGHLGEASDELVRDYPQEAAVVAAERRKLMIDTDYPVDCEALIAFLLKLNTDEAIRQLEEIDGSS